MIRTFGFLFCIALLNAAPRAGASDPVFLDGFPAVPLLEGFSEDTEARLVFDTVAGTIAETAVYSDFSDGLVRYEEALSGLGWVCVRVDIKSQCRLSGFRMSLTPGTNGYLTLKVAPAAAG